MHLMQTRSNANVGRKYNESMLILAKALTHAIMSSPNPEAWCHFMRTFAFKL